MGVNRKDGTYIVWRVWWLEEENGIYGASGFFYIYIYTYIYIYIYILEVLGGLCVWVEVWKE